MYNEMFPNVFEQSQSFFAPVLKANKLTVANLEKLVSFQLSALQSYTDMGIGQLKAAAEVSNLEELQAFVSKQVEIVGTVSQKLLDDAKTLADLGAGFKAELDKLAEESIAELTPTSTKGAARKAA